MIAAAKELGLDARVMDASQLSFDHEFDAVFSNAALHWIPAATDVVAGVRQSLAAGGRFVAEFGGAGNVATVMAAVNAQRRTAQLPASEPWYFPTATDYTAVLESQGFRIDSIELFPRPTPLPGHISDWIETFYRPFLGDIPGADWDEFVADVCESLAPSLRNENGVWHVDYVRLRFAACI
jgi:trans-aconitate methyltransferase